MAAFTSVPASQLRVPADLVVQVPARTMADKEEESWCAAQGAGTASVGAAAQEPSLPMGSSYELALQLFCDAVCLLLQRELGVTEGEMRLRHTNME